MGTVLLLVYLGGAMLALVPTARWYLREMCDGDTDSMSYTMSTVMSLLTVWFWPLYLPGWWIVQMLKSDDGAKR